MELQSQIFLNFKMLPFDKWASKARYSILLCLIEHEYFYGVKL